MLKTVVFAPMQTASVRVAKKTSRGSRPKLRTAHGKLCKLAVTLVPLASRMARQQTTPRLCRWSRERRWQRWRQAAKSNPGNKFASRAAFCIESTHGLCMTMRSGLARWSRRVGPPRSRSAVFRRPERSAPWTKDHDDGARFRIKRSCLAGRARAGQSIARQRRPLRRPGAEDPDSTRRRWPRWRLATHPPLTGERGGSYSIAVGVTPPPSAQIPLEQLVELSVDRWSRRSNVASSPRSTAPASEPFRTLQARSRRVFRQPGM